MNAEKTENLLSTENQVVIHAVPVTYRGGLSQGQLVRSLGLFADSYNKSKENKVFSSLFANKDENGITSIINSNGRKLKSFENIGEAVGSLRRYMNEHLKQNMGVVIGCYETKEKEFSSGNSPITDYSIHDLTGVFNIAGGVLPNDIHGEFLNIFHDFYNGPYTAFCRGVGKKPNSSALRSINNAKGKPYFEQAFLQEFTRCLNDMRFEIIGPNHYNSARFFRPNEDPLSQLEVFLNFMGNSCNVLPIYDRKGERENRIFYGLLDIGQRLEEKKPCIDDIMGNFSLRTVH